MIKLTPRLELCAAMCPPAGRAVDVGCDHGYLLIRLLKSGRAQRGLACDLRRGPLDNAARNIALHGLSGAIDTLQTDGLDGVTPTGSDLVTICGMGGDLMADILGRAPWTREAAVVLQPMTKQERLRRWLAQNGFRICEERLVYEDRRLYTLMRVAPGSYEGGEHMLFSAAMERDPLFPDYIRMMRVKLQRRYAGSGSDRDRALLQVLEEREACL